PVLFDDLEWHWIGPARGGRVTAVTGVPGDPGTYYFGATGGGVWKTTDYGRTWRNLSDGWLETPSIGGIRVAESNPEVVWVATGSDGLRSNIITGKGVYRSTDAGETWRFVGLRGIGNTGAIEVDRRDPDVAYVAAIGQVFGPSPDRGLYRTRDGGETWENVLFVSDSTGIVDVEIDPGDPDVVYASSWRGERKPWTIISGAHEGGVYRSTDGGDTWTELGTDAAPGEGGLPTGDGQLFGKIDLAVARSQPATVYALIEAPEPHDGLWRSDDAGATWRQVSSFDRLTARAFYYINVDVDPTDPEVVWVNAHVPLFRSTDGGESWHTVSTPHGDNHDIWIDPGNPDLMVQGNDGGANVSRDGGETWTGQTNQPTAEMYSVDLDDRHPYWVWGGQQDMDIVGVPSRPSTVGEMIHYGGGTCETGPAVPKPGDPDVIYNSCKGRFMVWHRETGSLQHYYVGGVYMYGHAARDLPYRFQRVSPVEVSPHDPDVVYHGSQYVHRTTDNGVTWERLSDDLTATPPGTQGISGEPITRDITGEEVYSTLYAIEESPVERGVIWVGSYDGPFHVSRDNGETWVEITPPDLPPGGRVQSIDPSPHAAGTAIYSVLRFMLDDWHPYVYRTRDYGDTWELLTTDRNGIPADYPVRVVREDPVRPGLLYAGAEFGIYVSFDDGARWQPLQLDLPAVPVTDMRFAPGAAAWSVDRDTLGSAVRHRGGDLVISTMGRGFHVLRDLTPLRALAPEVADAVLTLHEPAPATLTDWRSRRGGPPAPEYGDPGGVVDWVLAGAPGAVTVELLSPRGRVLNGWTSETGGYRLVEEEGMHGNDTVRVGGPRVPARAGHT
ncbi:MAG: WD40/YVTN/BNR-like repeat-containing protein, partial [Gemmatimonadota bacterium]